MEAKNRLAGLVVVARNTDRYASLSKSGASVSVNKVTEIISASIQKQAIKGASISTRVCAENMAKSYGL